MALVMDSCGVTNVRSSMRRTVCLGIVTIVMLVAMALTVSGCTMADQDYPRPQNRLLHAASRQISYTTKSFHIGGSKKDEKKSFFKLPWESIDIDIDIPDWVMNTVGAVPQIFGDAFSWMTPNAKPLWDTPIALPPAIPLSNSVAGELGGYVTGLGKARVPYVDMTPEYMNVLKADVPAVTAIVQKASRTGMVLTTGPRIHLNQPVTLQTAIQWWGSFREQATPVGKRGALASQDVLQTDLLQRLQSHVPGLTAESSLNREQICWLLAALSGKLDAAETMSGSAMAHTIPPRAAKKRYRMGAWMDAAAISPWARGPVAVAYREGWLHDYFGLTPEDLTDGQGFGPKTILSRADWLHIAACFVEAQPT